MRIELETITLATRDASPHRVRAANVVRMLLEVMLDAASRRCAKCRTKKPGIVNGLWHHTPRQSCAAQYERTQIELMEIWLQRLA